MPAADHQVDYILSASRQSYIASSTPTVNNSGDNWVSLGWTVKGEKLHPVVSVDLSDVITGKVSIGKFKWNADAAAESAEACWLERLLLSFVEADVTWNERSSGVGWNTVGAMGSGTDYTTTNRVAFNLSTGAPPVAMEQDIAALVQDANDAALTTLWLRLRRQTESSPNAETWWLKADSPTIELSVTPWLYWGWLECDEDINSVQDTTAKVVVQCGSRTFHATDDFLRVAWSLDPTMATGVTNTSGVDVSASDDGDWYDLPIAGLPTNTRIYYRVEASDDAEVSWPEKYRGDIRTFHTLPSATSTVLVTLSADAHRANAYARRGDTSHYQACVDIYDLTCENLASERDASGHPASLHISPGDGMMYAVSQSEIFPFKTDGSGDSDSPTSKAALTETDAIEIVRSGRNLSKFPFHSVPYIEGAANHWPSHWFHYAANVPANDDVAAWANDAMKNGIGQPMGAGGIFRGAATYRAFDHGPILFCMVDPYLDSYEPTNVTPPPVTMDSLANWKLSNTQRDFFLHATTGEIAQTTKPWVIVCIHNLVGGKGANGALPYYGRGGEEYVLEAGTYWADTVHPALLSLKQNNPNILGIIVVLGHDHLHQFGSVQGIRYCHLATPANEAGASAYGFGFAPQGGYGVNYMDNAGYYCLVASAAALTLTYKSTYLAGTGEADPSHGVLTNKGVIDVMALPAGGGGPATPPPCIAAGAPCPSHGGR